MTGRTRSIATYKKLADEYFSSCDNANSASSTKIVKPYTLSGLLCALALTREQFFSLGDSREGRRFVNYVILKIEAFIEENALSGKLSASAAANSLKYSFGWNEKAESTQEGSFSVSLSDEASRLGE